MGHRPQDWRGQSPETGSETLLLKVSLGLEEASSPARGRCGQKRNQSGNPKSTKDKNKNLKKIIFKIRGRKLYLCDGKQMGGRNKTKSTVNRRHAVRGQKSSTRTNRYLMCVS